MLKVCLVSSARSVVTVNEYGSLAMVVTAAVAVGFPFGLILMRFG